MFSGIVDGVLPRIVAGVLLTAGVTYCCQAPSASAAGNGTNFSFETVREMARNLAAKDFRPEQNADLPEAFKKLTYDEYQKIRFRPEHNLMEGRSRALRWPSSSSGVICIRTR